MTEIKVNKLSKKLDFTPMEILSKPLREDVVGKAGEFVDDFILSMNSESMYKKMGVTSDKTFLITGVPGIGKTLGIRSLINEVNKEQSQLWQRDIAVQPDMIGMSYDIGKYGTAYINMGSKIVQGFFDQCFNIAKKYKVLIEFDEAEVLFGNRASNSSHKEDNKVLNTIMKNVQIVHDTPDMYMVLMSNHPEAFDEASIRAGRIDKKYQFELPNEEERKLAYDHTISNINESAGYQVVRGFDNFSLASMTSGYSYADIVETVNSAVKKRAMEIIKTRIGKTLTSGYVSQKRLEDSIRSHSESFYGDKKGIGFL